MSNNQCTQKQAATLQKFGYNPHVSFDEASRIIDMIAANGWKRPEGQPPNQPQQAPAGQSSGGGGQATSGQKRVLQKFGYNPNVSFTQARQILDELKANNWQRPDGQPAPANAQAPPSAVPSQFPAPVPQQVASAPPQQFASYEDLPSFGQ